MSFPVHLILLRSGASPVKKALRSLDSLAPAWERHAKKEGAAIVHMPGEDLPLDSVPKDWEGFWGKVLVTEALWDSLPGGLPDLGGKVDRIEGFPLRLAPEPWPLGDPAPQGNWVPRFLEECPEFSDGFSRAGILDDASYLEKEASLDSAARGRAGVWRFGFLLGSGAVADRARNARFERLVSALPPWALERPLSLTRIPTRASRVFGEMGLERVSDLSGISDSAIPGFHSFGARSISMLKEGLFLEVEKIPRSGSDHLAFGRGTLDGRTLLGMIAEDIGQLSEIQRQVMEDRIGLYGPRRWMKRVAEIHGITRERVRQIERRVSSGMRRSTWAHWLFGKLDMILESGGGCVRISDLPAADPFFAGFDMLGDALPRILALLGCGPRVMDFPGGKRLCALAEGDWPAALERAERLVIGRIPDASPPEACRALVMGCFDGAGLGELLWGVVEPRCHFLPDDSGALGLCSYGESLHSRFDSILEASSEPLHYLEIWRRCCHSCGWKRVQALANSRAILLDQGMYGFERHLGFPLENVDSLAKGVEGIVAGAPEKAQWHCAELLAELQRLGLAGESMTKYEVNYVLGKAGGMRDLKRLVWGRESSALERRISIHDAVVSILRDEGKPLGAAEIRARLSRMRGLNGDDILIPHKPPIKKFGRGIWGLESWAGP